MSSESDQHFQEILEMDQNDFFDFNAYYGEGSYHENITSSNASNDNTTAGVPGLGVTSRNQLAGATLMLGATSLLGKVQGRLEQRPIQSPADARQGCHVQPFNRLADLERHMQAMHGTTSYPCPHDTCPAHTHNFKRKDKLQQHMREKHADLLEKCQNTHCIAKISKAQQPMHQKDDHGEYECSIDNCETAANSYFTKSKLDKHLRDHHKMTRGVCKSMMESLTQFGETTVHRGHLPSSTRAKPWEQCSVCPPVAQQQQGANVMTLDEDEEQYYY
ncbi:hypothetical protein QBC43DRAFT_371260 [Cladorrhinum sp. PSN259]|nr:hypothetical protein QBC43DRAFT_371260 [Cladorrhinum sp. PSN259]